MTVRRFPAPAAPAPAFPMWPYVCTAYFENCSLDYIDYVDRLTRAEGAAAVIAAEEALGLNLLGDMHRTLLQMWSPLRATLSGPGAFAP